MILPRFWWKSALAKLTRLSKASCGISLSHWSLPMVNRDKNNAYYPYISNNIIGKTYSIAIVFQFPYLFLPHRWFWSLHVCPSMCRMIRWVSSFQLVRMLKIRNRKHVVKRLNNQNIQEISYWQWQETTRKFYINRKGCTRCMLSNILILILIIFTWCEAVILITSNVGTVIDINTFRGASIDK